MRNLKLTIAYDGTEYSGWQRQHTAVTIQGEIEKVLSRLCNTHIDLHGAGRTDAGVHALAMIAHFHTDSNITAPDFKRALNSILPGAIRITASEEVDNSFHSRFSATAKTYFYTIETAPVQDPFNRLFALHFPQQLDTEKINTCLNILTGTHDFASFEASGSRDTTLTTGRGSVRTIFTATLEKISPTSYRFTFKGDGFLRHMVRNLVGTLLDVGRGRTTVEGFTTILAAKDRASAGPTAPAHGLFLQKVSY